MDYKRTKKQKEQCWKELEKALKNLFKDKTYGSYSRPIKMQFGRGDGGANLDKEIHLFTEEIDNVYSKDIYDEELGFRWEIYLHRDGTWTIK